MESVKRREQDITNVTLIFDTSTGVLGCRIKIFSEVNGSVLSSWLLQ